jgi:signal transduction histidine kinase
LRRFRVFHTESFRLAALFAALFLGLAGVLLATVYWIVEDTQTAALLKVVEGDIKTISNGYRDEGLEEAIEVVQQRLGTQGHSNVDLPGGYILLDDATQGRVAGNLPPLPRRTGTYTLTVPAAAGGPPQDSAHAGAARETSATVLGTGVFVAEGLYLYVGRDTATIEATRERILRAFVWIAGGATLLAAAGGILFSVQFLRRIDAITRTCNAIVAGRFNDRIPLRGSSDELDRLATVINSMLDRIAALLDNLRQVSSDVAHDLRTPLTHLRRRLEQARLNSASMDDYGTAVTRALSDTDELLAMFTALLRISQVEAGTRLSAFRAFALSELLDRVYEMYRPVAEDYGHTLELDLRDEVSIRGDAELLTQMFSNLIENALRHTPPDTRVVVALDASNGRALVSVSDTGPGIPPEERDKVLRRFYRLTGSRSTPGNGLGLALVAAIVNLHQATIELGDNAPGLRVSISLPMA